MNDKRDFLGRKKNVLDSIEEIKKDHEQWRKEHENTSAEIVDYSFECSNCGKPMPYRSCGMCVTCEQEYNG